jgi:murein L,D-transpeptidase YafK
MNVDSSIGYSHPLLRISIFATGCNRAPRATLPQANRIVVSKSNHTLTLMRHGQIIRTYKVALGKGNGEAKQRAGDHQTPEGLYVIDAKKSQSRFHLALHISYPNAEDTRRAAKTHVSPGGVEINGLQNGLGWIGSAEHWSIGPTAASRFQTTTWTKSGRPSP